MLIYNTLVETKPPLMLNFTRIRGNLLTK